MAHAVIAALTKQSITKYSSPELLALITDAENTLAELKRLDLEQYSREMVESLTRCKAQIETELQKRRS